MLVYATTDANGNITGLFARPQAFSTVEIDDADPKVTAFLASLVPPPTLTFLQFMALFTPAEQTAIFGSNDVQVKMFITMAAGSGGLQLNNAEVVNGVGYLASISLITAPRATAILAGQSPS